MLGRFPRVLLAHFGLSISTLLGCGDDSPEDATSSSSSSAAGGGATSTSSTSGSPTGSGGSTSSGQGGDGGDPTTTTSDGGTGGGGGTGEGGGLPCDGADACDDGNACTDDACVDGFCESIRVEDGTPIAVDGNPCTDDECLDGEETHTTIPAGAPGTDEDGGCDGLCQAAPYDGECGLSVYRKVYPGGDDTWTRDALSSIWMGDNAPPPRDLLEAEQTFEQDRLLVWAADGTFYERQDGTWLEPVASTDRFENLPAGDIVAMTIAFAPTFNDTTESLTITTNEAQPRVLGYNLFADGSLEYGYGPNLLDNAQAGDPDAPPQQTTPYDWGFAQQAAAPFQDDAWIHFWEALGGRIYDLDGSSGGFDFLGSETEADSTLFAGDGGPAAGTVVAAYYDAATDQVFLIAP